MCIRDSTYTFTLRDGVKFHDGSTVTAEDVKYSIDRCADTTNGAPLVEAYSHIQSVNILDEKTVEVVLDGPDTEFLAYMTEAIIPASNENPDTNPIGTGPYKYVSRSPQENFVVEKFDDYWGTPANIEHVTFKVCANADSIVMDLQGGSIDMFARVTTAQAAQLGEQYQICLLYTSISGATDVIINVSGDISMYDADDAASYVQQLTGDDVNIIFGAMYDDSAPDTCQITVIATGIEDKPQAAQNKFGSSFSVKPPVNSVKQVQPGMASRPFNNPAQNLQPAPAKPAPSQPAFTGIQKPGNLRSNVKEKSLNIPDFLQRGNGQKK